MARVKVSQVRPMTVVPYRPWRRFAVRVLGTVMVVAAIGGAYLYGLGVGEGDRLAVEEERDSLQQSLLQARQLHEALRLRVTFLERASEVDRQATEDVRRVNRELSGRIAQLEDEISLYQGIMSPTVGGEGLRIQELTLTAVNQDRRFRYNLVLTQVGGNSDYLQGFVGLNIVGIQAGERRTIALKEISEDIDEVDIGFRYRYFQDFRGELILPEDFAPEEVQVVAQSVGNRSARVEMTFDWSEVENGNNVGQQN